MPLRCTSSCFWRSAITPTTAALITTFCISRTPMTGRLLLGGAPPRRTLSDPAFPFLRRNQERMFGTEVSVRSTKFDADRLTRPSIAYDASGGHAGCLGPYLEIGGSVVDLVKHRLFDGPGGDRLGWTV